ncbi:MAG: alpha/beta hydrolase [Janthinobacterium lividum]
MPSAKTTPKNRKRNQPLPPETVDPRWLLRAGGAVLALGVLCAYISVCALFYFQQWQFVLHPSHTVAQTPDSQGLRFEAVRFGDDPSGQPQLTGWWIPSDLPSDPTVLMLHGQDGSMSDAVPAAKALHDARMNVLLFDYRGYGQSGGDHPTEQKMTADASSGLAYLTQTRGISPTTVLAYGSELGASLAVNLCMHHPELPAVILQSADGDTETRVLREERSRMVPLRLFFHERFLLADPLHTLKTPKLLISLTNGHAPVDAQRAADPKLTAELPPGADAQATTQVIRRFLDTYVVRPPSLLKP